MQSSLVGSFVPLLEKLRFLNICYVLLVWSVGRSVAWYASSSEYRASSGCRLAGMVGRFVGWLVGCLFCVRSENNKIYLLLFMQLVLNIILIAVGVVAVAIRIRNDKRSDG